LIFRKKPRRLGLPQMSQAPHFNAWEPQLGGKIAAIGDVLQALVFS